MVIEGSIETLKNAGENIHRDPAGIDPDLTRPRNVIPPCAIGSLTLRSPRPETIFGELIRESLQCRQELTDDLGRLDGKTNGGNNIHKGAIYRTWETHKTPIEGNSSKAILEVCEQESEALGHAYEAALSAPPQKAHPDKISY